MDNYMNDISKYYLRNKTPWPSILLYITSMPYTAVHFHTYYYSLPKRIDELYIYNKDIYLKEIYANGRIELSIVKL